MTISVALTVYNTWKQALRSVRAIHEFRSVEIKEIIIVDDVSEPDAETRSALEAIPSVQVLQNKRNIGYVKSVNVAVNLCTSDIVLLLDSDAYINSPFDVLLRKAFIADASLGAVGFTLTDEQGYPTGSVGPEPSQWSLLLGQRLHGVFSGKSKNKSIVIFSCGVAFRRTAYDQVGGFDERFEFLEADIDFCMALTRAGWSLNILPDISAIHYGGGSSQGASKRVPLFYTNRHKLLTKYNLITWPQFLKTVVLTRLHLETLILTVFAPYLYNDPAVRLNKIIGRKKLVHLVKKTF